jgi:hypothetical protein
MSANPKNTFLIRIASSSLVNKSLAGLQNPTPQRHFAIEGWQRRENSVILMGRFVKKRSDGD